MTVVLSATPTLSTERLTLRAPVAADWPAYRDYMTSDRARWTGGPKPAPEGWRAFGHLIGHWVLRGFGLFVFHLHGEDRPLGVAGPYRPEGWPETEIGWQLWSGADEGRGYATEAARATLDHARDALRWPAAVSYIRTANAASIRVAERLGATPDPAATPPAEDVLVYRHWGPA